MLDPIGDPDDAGRRDYFSLIRHNVSLLVKPAEGE
jgi:hypothetical protein